MLNLNIISFQIPFKARVVFLLGNTASPDSGLEQEIREEEAGHGDIIREDFLDTYQNLTLKTLAGIKWTGQFCHQAEFVMKTDDDMYVNLVNLFELVKTNKDPYLMTGWFCRHCYAVEVSSIIFLTYVFLFKGQ